MPVVFCMTEYGSDFPSGRGQIAAVVVTYHPSGDVESRLTRMAAQGGALVVVDNASAPSMQRELASMCHQHSWGWLQNSENLGVGAAVNEGVKWLAARGFEWALLFDQDSEPAPDLGERIIQTWRRHPQASHVAIIGVSYDDLSTGRRYRVLRPHRRCAGCFEKTAVGTEDLRSVTAVVTSGSLVRVSDFLSLGGFDEGLFVDHVDTDFCLRCVENGRLVAVSASARLGHRFGDRTRRKWLGFELQPTNHSAVRHYFAARNRVPMIRRHGRRVPHWLWFEIAAALLSVVRVVTVEEQRRAKLRAMVLGTWDGVRGRLGPCPSERLRQF